MFGTIALALLTTAFAIAGVAAATFAPGTLGIASAHGGHAPNDCVFQQGPTLAFHDIFINEDGHGHEDYAVRFGPADDAHWHYITVYRDTDGDNYGEAYNGSLNNYRDAYGQCDIDAEYFSREVFVITGVWDPADSHLIGTPYLSQEGVTNWWRAGRGD